MEKSFAELKTRLAEIHDLRRTQEILFWDQTVMMPPGGSSVRGQQVTTLDRIAHEKFISDEIGETAVRILTYIWREDGWGLTAVRTFPRGREALAFAQAEHPQMRMLSAQDP